MDYDQEQILRKLDTIGHTKRARLITDMKDNKPATKLAKRSGISERTIRKYKKEMMVKPVAYDLLEDGKGVMKMLQELINNNKSLYDDIWLYLKGDPEKDPSALIALSNTLTRQLELMAKLVGQIKDVNISIINSPVWVQIQQTIINAVADFPEARERLAEALGKIE